MEIKCSFLHPYIFIGPEGAVIEGVKRIVAWNEEKIEMVSGQRISVMGSRLKIEYKSLDCLLIKGEICNISFSRVKNK